MSKMCPCCKDIVDNFVTAEICSNCKTALEVGRIRPASYYYDEIVYAIHKLTDIQIETQRIIEHLRRTIGL